MIFSRGKVRKYPIFDFDGISLECTCEYNYLGIMFKYNNKFGSALNRNLLSANKSMFAILNKCYKMNLPILYS